MNQLKYVCMLLISFLFIQCGSDNDDNPSALQQASLIKGTWSDSVKINFESLKATLILDETNGTINGSGKIKFINKTDKATKEIQFETDASGTFQSNDVVVNVNYGSDKFTFSGKLSNDNSTMSGTTVIIFKNNFVIPDSTYNFNMNLKKK